MKKITLLLFAVLLGVSAYAQVTTTAATNNTTCDGSATLTNSNQFVNWKWYKNDTLKQNGGATFNNLCVGSYSVITQDTSLSYDTAAFVIATNNPCNNFTASLTATNESSNGACDGTLSVTSNSSIATYVWSDTSFHNNQVTGVCSGSYSVSVTDTAGCNTTVYANVMADTTNNPCNGFSASISHTNESAPGACDGTLTLTVNRPLALYTWSDSTFNSTNVTGVCGGSYTITVKDSLNCIKTSSAFVGSDTTNNGCNGLTLNISVTNESAAGACDGTLSANFNGYAVSYVWSDSSYHNAQQTGVCAGQYSLTVTDSSGCLKTATAFISTDTTQGPCSTFSASIASTNETTAGACDGSLTVTANRTLIYYSWSDSTSGPTVSNACSGSYHVVVKDSLNCQLTVNGHVGTDSTSNPCNGISASIAVTNETAAGACDGSLAVTTNSFAVSYVWSDSTFQNATVTNVCAGTYMVTITDSSGCQASATATVGSGINPCANFAVTISSTTNQTFPGACNGMASATVNNGIAPFLFNWGSGLTSTSPHFSGLCSGNFTLTVTDSAGCSATTTGSVGTDSVVGPCNGVAINVLLTQVSATAGNCDGDVTSTVNGGTAPYLYFWNNGYHTSSLVNVCPGYYNVQVKDINGCLGAESVLVQGDTSVPVPLVISITTHDVDSAGACNGTAYINAAGGVAPYSITYSTGTAGSQAANLCAGYYHAYVTDANGHSDSLSFVIGSPENTYNGNTQNPLNDSVVVATLTAEALQSCEIDFTTIDSIAITSYYLGNNDSIVVEWTIYSTASGDTVLTQLYGVGPFGVYEVVLSIYCEGRTGEGFAKAYGKILVNSSLPTGIATVVKTPQTTVYPNPFNSTVNMNLAIATRVSLTDISGKVVFVANANAGSFQIDASNLAKGVYFIILQNNTGREVKKLVKE